MPARQAGAEPVEVDRLIDRDDIRLYHACAALLLSSSAPSVPKHKQGGKRGDECDLHGRVPRLNLHIEQLRVRCVVVLTA
jgi:hypothetical protein